MYATEQYDAYEALMHMMRCYAEILERKHTSLPSELFTSIVTERQYAPGQEVMTNKNYGKMADSLKTEEKQAEFHIILPLQANFDAHKRSCSFDQLLKQFFDNPRVQDSDPIIGKDAEGKTRKFHLLSEKQKFTSAPEQLTLVLNRTGMSRERGVYKIDVPVDVPHILTLSPEMTGDKETSIYKLACAILHSGPYGGGHYTMVKAVGNDWIELNDEKSTFVSENYISEMERKIFPSTGYVYHYVKENG
jgi:hypothetical protein